VGSGRGANLIRRVGTLALCVSEQEELLTPEVDEGGCWAASTGDGVDGERKTVAMMLSGAGRNLKSISIGSSVQMENTKLNNELNLTQSPGYNNR
jgi:hypothetical protein